MNWSSVERLFAAALETPLEERQGLLDSDPDAAVRAEVRRLLVRHDALSSGHDPFLHTLDLDCVAALVEAVEPADPTTVGHYQIIRRLGAGATGVVYLARDQTLGRQVGLKLLSPYLSNDATAVRRFTDEARAASRLDHPHIIAIHEIGRSVDGRLFIAMAYHEGETLRERLARGPLPVAEAVRIAGDVADGLSVAHANGIVHRDIKPENILLTTRGACIVDFGIAKVAGETITRTGSVLGTAAYMSPEQTRGTEVDQRSDLWSLGVVLYEMLAGSRPFRADAGEALIYGIRHDAAESVMVRRPGLAPAVARIVDGCLEKEPDRRYQSAAALLGALRAPLAQDGGARPPTRWRRIGLAVGGAMVLAAGAGLLAAPERHPASGLPAQLSTVLPRTAPPGAIAILPFAEGPADESLDGREYLREGITEGISNELTRGLSAIPGIRVSSRPSVRILADSGADVRTLGRRLGVSALLEWSLSRSDSLVVVRAHLIRASDGRKIWAHVYERQLGELGTIPEEIRRSVAVTLGFGDADSARGRHSATNDLVAYDLYARGRFAYSKWTPAGVEEAAGLFRQAIARDSGFALAYAALAGTAMSAWSGVTTDRFQAAKPLVARALESDSTLPSAHELAGWIALWQDRDWTTAERHLRRALALDSSSVLNYHHYAAFLAATGRVAEGLAIARGATAIDPISSITAVEVGRHLYWNRRYLEAIAVLERALMVDSIWSRQIPIVLGKAYLAVGRHDDAIREFRRAGAESSEGFEAPALLGHALGIAGRTPEARLLVSQYVARGRASSARPMDLVAVYLGIGDTIRALDWVEQIPGDRGSIHFLLSEPMFDPLRGSPRFRRVLDTLGLGLWASRADSIRAERGKAPPVARSVGVLPFVNMSPERENTYFSDGLSEQIIAALSRIDGLQVAARTSSFALRDRRLDVRAVGEALGVATVLEGSVRKDRNRLRVAAQLIDASTGYRIWSDEYNRELEDIFAVQEEIARAIAGALELRLPRRGAVTQARRTPNLEAYDLYLRGLYLRNSLTEEALRQATDFFDRAIELEPGFALAYAAKASVVAPRIYFRHMSREKGVREVRDAVARALELDPALGEAHAALGMLRLFFDWDWQGAEHALRRAIELNPSDPHAYHMLANYLSAMGRAEDAVGARLRAVELDPLNARTGILLGADYQLAGHVGQAIVQYRRAIRLDPVNPLALGRGPGLPVGPAGVFLEQGRLKEAAEEYLRLATLRGATASELDSIRSAFARSDIQDFWRSWLAMDLRQSGDSPDPLRVATLWAMIGDTAQALDWLDRAYAERNPGLIYLRSGSTFENLRSHPRVARILKEMKFPTR